MSLTIRAKALLAASLIIGVLLAPTVYSVVVLREISTLASTLAGRDARAGVMAARLVALFDEAHRSARLLKVDPDFRSALDRAAGEMNSVLNAVKVWADPPLVEEAAKAASDLAAFRKSATDPSATEADFDYAEAIVRSALRRITQASQDLAARRTAAAERLAHRAATLTLLSAAVGLVFAALLWAALLRALGRPLRDLLSGTERVAQGRFEEIPVRAHDELGRLAESFNRMAGALGELDRMKAEFLSAASHGLRTPLACAKGYLAALESGRQGALTDDCRRAVRRVEEEIDRVSRFVDQLLDLGRLRSGRLPMSMREVPATAFFTSVGRSFEALAGEKGIAYQIRIDETVPARITADADRLSEALINLLGNAFKYTPSGGSVTLSVSGEDEWVRVEVADTGPGIPAEEVPLIFEKYYRGEGVTAEGAGLGLAISRGIVERHGGAIWAESEEGAGARFIFRVPARQAAAGSGAESGAGDSGSRTSDSGPRRSRPGAS